MPKLDVVFGPNGPYLKPGGVEGTSRVDVDTLNLMIQNAKVTGTVPLKDIEAAVPEKHVRFAELAEQFGKNVMALDAWVDQICTKHDNYQATKPYEKYILSRQVAYAQMLRDSLVRIDDELIGKLQAELTKLIAEEEEAKKAMAELCASSTPVTKSSLFSTDRLINFADGITRAAWTCFKYTIDAVTALLNSMKPFFQGTARYLVIFGSFYVLRDLLLEAAIKAGKSVWESVPVTVREWVEYLLQTAWSGVCALVALIKSVHERYGWPGIAALAVVAGGSAYGMWWLWRGLRIYAASHHKDVDDWWKRKFDRGDGPNGPGGGDRWSKSPRPTVFNSFADARPGVTPIDGDAQDRQWAVEREERDYKYDQQTRQWQQEALDRRMAAYGISKVPDEKRWDGLKAALGGAAYGGEWVSPAPPVSFSQEAAQAIADTAAAIPPPPADLSTALVASGATAAPIVLSQPGDMSDSAFEYLKVQLTSLSFLFTICVSVYASSALAPSIILANTFLAGFQFVTRNALIDAADKMMGLNKTSPWYPLFRLALTIPIGAAVTGSFSTVRLIGPAAAAARAYISPREVAEVTQEAGRFLGAGFDPVQDRPAFIAAANQLGGYVAQMPPIFTPPPSSTSSVLDSIPKDVVTETKEGTIGLITTKLADIFKSTANLVKEATVGSESDNDLRKELVVTLTRANETVASAVTQEQLADALEKAKTALVVWTGKTQARSSDYLDAMSRFAGKTLSAVEAVMTLAATARMRA